MSDNRFEIKASDDYFETITEASMWGVFRSEDDPGGGLVAAFEKHAEAKDYAECSENEFLCVLPMTLTGEYCNRDDDDASALASRHPQLRWDMPSTGTQSAAQLSGQWRRLSEVVRETREMCRVARIFGYDQDLDETSDSEWVAALAAAFAEERARARRIGQRLRDVRAKSGKTMGDLARFLGVSVVEISAIERGRV